MADQEQEDYSLIMPFILCKSRGGPYEDVSFVAGYRLGMIDALLNISSQTGAPVANQIIPTVDVPQLDLLAMRFGYVVTCIGEKDEWSTYSFTKIEKE